MTAHQVQFTIDDLAKGEAIASDLLRERLVACAQTIGPITSRYWWNGSINQAQEWLFLCKTTPARVDEVVERIRRLHPYEVPEIVVCEISAALDVYADWIVAETQVPPSAASFVNGEMPFDGRRDRELLRALEAGASQFGAGRAVA